MSNLISDKNTIVDDKIEIEWKEKIFRGLNNFFTYTEKNGVRFCIQCPFSQLRFAIEKYANHFICRFNCKCSQTQTFIFNIEKERL